MSSSELEQMRKELEALRTENATLTQQIEKKEIQSGREILELLRNDKIENKQYMQDAERRHLIKVAEEIVDAFKELDDLCDRNVIDSQQKIIVRLEELNKEIKSAELWNNAGVYAAFGGKAVKLAANGGLFILMGYPGLEPFMKGFGILGECVGLGTAVYKNSKVEELWIKAYILVNETSEKFKPLAEAALKFNNVLKKHDKSIILTEKLAEVCKSAKNYEKIKHHIGKFQTVVNCVLGIGFAMQVLEVVSFAVGLNIFSRNFYSAFNEAISCFTIISTKCQSHQDDVKKGLQSLQAQLDVMCAIVMDEAKKEK